MPFRRRRFVDLVERQLDLFEREHAGLIGDTREALAAYDAAERDEADERYGEYLDLVETGQDQLEEIRDTYAKSLEAEAAEEYRAVFNDRARRRLGTFGLELD